MKRSGTAVVFVIAWVAVLLGAYGIGLCVREVRLRHVKPESKIFAEPRMSTQMQKPSGTRKPASEPVEVVQVPPDIKPMPDSEAWEDLPAFLPEKSGKLKKAKGKTEEKREKMSGEDKKELKAQMREMFGGKDKGVKKEYPKLYDEEKASLKEEWRTVKKGMKEGWESMSE